MLSIPAPCGDDPVGMDEKTLPTLGPSPSIFVHTLLRLDRFATLFSGSQTKFRLSLNDWLNGAAMLVREVTMLISNAGATVTTKSVGVFSATLVFFLPSSLR
jgi:hypothetical protein